MGRLSARQVGTVIGTVTGRLHRNVIYRIDKVFLSVLAGQFVMLAAIIGAVAVFRRVRGRLPLGTSGGE